MELIAAREAERDRLAATASAAAAVIVPATPSPNPTSPVAELRRVAAADGLGPAAAAESAEGARQYLKNVVYQYMMGTHPEVSTLSLLLSCPLNRAVSFSEPCSFSPGVFP